MPLTAQSAVIERVTDFKILGVIFSSDLTWTKHVQYIAAKARKRLFAICQLVRCGFASDDVVAVYCSLNRPLLEYASPVWHCGLTDVLSKELEHCADEVFAHTFSTVALFRLSGCHWTF